MFTMNPTPSLQRLGMALLLVTLSGCTTTMLQTQHRPDPNHKKVCPTVYAMTRLDLAGLDWAFSNQTKPESPCLQLYFPKAEKDGFYQNSVRWMSPLMILSLPPGIIFDTLFLPATLSNLD